jgi:23S rRNA (uracil1939-C5)-methyltransferase
MPAETIELVIESLGAGGDGVARTPEGPLYVPFALPGEHVRVKPAGRRGEGRAAELIELITAAPERATPPCRHFGTCGGCALQHFAGPAYLEWKRGLVVTALSHRGLAGIEVRSCVPTPPGSRRRVRLRAARHGSGADLGLNRRRSREIVPLEECPLLRPALAALLAPLARLMASVQIGRRPIEVQLTETQGGVDLWIVDDMPLMPMVRAALVHFADSFDLARVSHGGRWPELVLRRRPATLAFGPASVEPPPSSFLQPSAEGQAAIQALIGEAARGAGRIADLFAGAGTLSLPLATAAAVDAFDADADALSALDAGVRAAAGLRPLRTYRRDLFRRPLQPAEFKGYDAVVLDPPRAGAQAQAEALAASPVELVAAASCNPATFARDARILVDGGFRLDWVAPVDQFLWSPEVELVACFRR